MLNKNGLGKNKTIQKSHKLMSEMQLGGLLLEFAEDVLNIKNEKELSELINLYIRRIQK
jgi:hypothetical protein